MTLDNKKNINIEVLRIISAFFVLFNHSAAFELYQVQDNIFLFTICCFISIISKVSVPIFFMISGYLLIDKNEDIKAILNKRVKKIFVILLIFSFGLYIKYPLAELIKTKTFNLKTWIDFIPQFLSGTISRTTSYWFLYSYIGMLLFLPLSSFVAKNVKRDHILIILVITVITELFVPFMNIVFQCFDLNLYISLNDSFNFSLFTNCSLIYPILGYYYGNNEIKSNKPFITNVVFIIANIFIVYFDGISNGFSQKYIGASSSITAILVFESIIHCGIKYDEKAKTIISKIGSSTLCVYLLEPYCRWLLYDYLYIMPLNFVKSVFICSIIWCIFCFIIGYFVSIILKKIPIIKNYL